MIEERVPIKVTFRLAVSDSEYQRYHLDKCHGTKDREAITQLLERAGFVIHIPVKGVELELERLGDYQDAG